MESGQDTTEWGNLLSPGAQSPIIHENPAALEALQSWPAAILLAVITIIGAKAWQNYQNKD